MSKFGLILSVDLRRLLFKEARLTSTMSISLALRFTRPLYYIISSRVCQEVLKKFFKFFSKPFQKLSLPFLTRLLYYIISQAVCQEVFQKFLEILFRRSCELFAASLSLTAIIVYHTCRDLSRGFSNFFEIIFPHPFSTISYFQFSVGVHASYTLSVRRRLIINIIEIMSH